MRSSAPWQPAVPSSRPCPRRRSSGWRWRACRYTRPETRAFVNIKHKAPDEVVKRLDAEDVLVSSRIGGIRVSPYFYNTEAEVEAFLEKIRRLGR